MAGLRHPVAGEPHWNGEAGSRPVDPSVRTARVEGTETRLAQLGRTIEGEIIPRLMMAHLADSAAPGEAPGGEQALSNGEVAEFAAILLGQDTAAAASFVDGLFARSVPLDSVFLDLLSPTARRLGEMWAADRCSFTDVTVALGRLQQMLRVLSRACSDGAPSLEFGRRALVVAAPGEQHTFGALMVAEFLRRAGWDVACEPGVSRREVLACVRSERFAVVGLSVSSEQHMDDLASTIRRIRRDSLNGAVGVLVGGNLFVEHPEYVSLVGADAMAADARQAVDRAENLLALLPARGKPAGDP